MAHDPDHDLLIRFLEGDHEAFEALVERFEQPITRFLQRWVRNPDVLEDLFQETFLRVLRSAHTFKPTARVSTWVHRIAQNLCYDYFKRESYRKTLSLDASPRDVDGNATYGSQLESSERSVEEQVALSELEEMLLELVERLPEKKRVALYLHHFKGLKYSEIAELMDEPEGTIKFRVHEGKKEIGRELRRRTDDETH